MNTPPTGTIALIGAGEYLPAVATVDQQLLERVSGTPRVVVLPTAAVPDGPVVAERWIQMGIDHFTRLGATVEPIRLFTRADANNEAIVTKLAAANFIYFSGGKPRYLLETLKDSAAWQAICGVYASGGVIAGCSAGAMALGGVLLDFPRVWRTLPALALVPDIAVIPHFDEIPSFITSMIRSVARKTTVVGIDGSTALVGTGGQWTVLGKGKVTLFSGKNTTRYLVGDCVPLQKNALNI
ncbi:MAG TPA: Type 1 glutamine amidotransferase-like domain-containing protein [Ktedonobacteraceae bacterium]|nr:Type 1 glutamine amidotransferase-like domain-containing protein [Ktedonobacteraceae bacterium]